MDFDLLAMMGVKLTWKGDRLLTLADAKPRHLGRPIGFTYYDSVDTTDYDSIEVLGIFEGVSGQVLQVSGVEYSYDRTGDIKIYRRETA